MTLRLLFRLALPCAVLCAPARVLASESFPPLIAQVYRLGGEPACTLCHATLKGGDETITTKVGKDMESRGVRGKNPGSLNAALRTAFYDRQDSDGDEVTDFEELREGTDPNDGSDATPDPGGGEGGAGGGFELGEVPELPRLPAHGCSFSLPSRAPALSSLALVAALAAFWRRRRVASR